MAVTGAGAPGLGAAGATGRLTWTVGGLVQAVGDALDARFGACTVQGELSGYARATSGHSYFVLKDADGAAASLRCTLFRRSAFLLGFQPADGQRVELRGRVSVYGPRGDLQFIVESMQLAGAGALLERLQRRKERLSAEGLFDPARKRALPRFPAAVGVVTSLGAAALHDVCSTLARRSPHVRVVVYPAPVQGADAPAAIVQALATAAGRAEVDLLILCRGGGALEDLLAFSDEAVVRAVAASPLPIVCGVGHETDVTLADHAADRRAATPTAAAELAAPATDACRRDLHGAADALHRRTRRRLDEQSLRLDALAARAARPGALLERARERLDGLQRGWPGRPARRLQAERAVLARMALRLRLAARSAQLRLRHRHEAPAARLAALDPRRVLERGYAWLTGMDGHARTTAAGVRAAGTVTATLQDGSVSLQTVPPVVAPRRAS